MFRVIKEVRNDDTLIPAGTECELHGTIFVDKVLVLCSSNVTGEMFLTNFNNVEKIMEWKR